MTAVCDVVDGGAPNDTSSDIHFQKTDVDPGYVQDTEPPPAQAAPRSLPDVACQVPGAVGSPV